jgi:ankyrin repeat protein
LKKLCKDRLATLRASDPQAKLAAVQLDVARAYGFASWRKLKAHVEALQPNAAVVPAVAPDDPDLVRLLAAAQDGDVAALTEVLERRPELVNAKGRDHQTALHAGVASNDPSVVDALIQRGANPELRYDKSGHTALSWATVWNSPAYAQALVRHGSKPDLFTAAGMGLLAEVQAYFDEHGQLRPGAVQTGSTRYGTDGAILPCPPESAVEQVSDAFYMACRNAHADVARFLLTRGADLSFKAFMGGTPLHWAYFGGDSAIVAMLEQAGADTAARDDVMHCTPRAFGICAPANWGIPNMVRQRLAADPSLARLMDGRTSALHEAARSGNAEVVVVLLTGGADPRLPDGDGKSALDIATERGHARIAEVLARVITVLEQREQPK